MVQSQLQEPQGPYRLRANREEMVAPAEVVGWKCPLRGKKAMDKKFRVLRADEIDVRVAQAKKTGVSLLLYKDARVDMSILDETVGPENWQRRHYECKGNLFCSVGIKEGSEWVWKDDAGAESIPRRKKAKLQTASNGPVSTGDRKRALYFAFHLGPSK